MSDYNINHDDMVLISEGAALSNLKRAAGYLNTEEGQPRFTASATRLMDRHERTTLRQMHLRQIADAQSAVKSAAMYLKQAEADLRQAEEEDR